MVITNNKSNFNDRFASCIGDCQLKYEIFFMRKKADEYVCNGMFAKIQSIIREINKSIASLSSPHNVN